VPRKPLADKATARAFGFLPRFLWLSAFLIEKSGVRGKLTRLIVINFGVSEQGNHDWQTARRRARCVLEADDFQPRANVEKMHTGRALTDEDRWPWLKRLPARIMSSLAEKGTRCSPVLH